MLPLDKAAALRHMMEKAVMNTSDAGLRFIAGWEGLRNQLYNDDWKPLATSKGNCTIGVGHLVHVGPCTYAAPSEFPFFGGITDDEAIALMREDVPRYEAVVRRSARVPLTQNQFDALVDFCFNTGGGYPAVWNTLNSGGDVTAVLMRTAIKPDWATAALVRRRKAECALFNNPIQPEEDEMWVRLNGVAAAWNNWTINRGPDGVMQLAVDFPALPATVKAVDLDVYLSPASKGDLIFKDGSGAFAGKVTRRAPQKVIRVVPQNRTVLFAVDGDSAQTETVGVVGYIS